MSLFLLGLLTFSPDRKPWAYLFAALLLIHGLISLYLAAQKYLKPHRIYPAQNRTLLLQLTLGRCGSCSHLFAHDLVWLCNIIRRVHPP